MLVEFALRNVFRHRARSTMTLAVIALGVAALIVSAGLVANLYRQLAEAVIHSQTGHLEVATPAFFSAGSRSPEKHRIEGAAKLGTQLSRVPGVSEVTARLAFSGLLSNARTQLPIIGEGIEADKAARLATSISILDGHRLGAGDHHGALVGEGLANALGLHPGDPVTLLASTFEGAVNTADLEVAGIFRSFSKDYDARAVKIPLEVAQDLLGTPDANVLVVLLADTGRTLDVQSTMAADVKARGLVVRNWQELNDFYTNTVRLFDRQFGVLRLIILFMVALGVSNAINMAIFERLGEFGTMRALGDRDAKVFRLVLIECVFLGTIGACLGVLVGVIVAALVSITGIPMPPPPNSNIGFTARVDLSFFACAEAFAIGWIATVLAGLIPAAHARRVPIIDALRRAV